MFIVLVLFTLAYLTSSTCSGSTPYYEANSNECYA